MNAKIHEPGLGGDRVNNPFSTIANLLLCVFYFFYLYLYRENAFRWIYESDASTKEKRTSMLYFGGVTLFAVGYGCLGMGYAFSWDNEQEGGTWDADLIWDMFIAGSALFAGGATMLFFQSTKPWNFVFSHWSDLLFCTEALNCYGSLFFLFGSVWFWWGSHVGKDLDADLSLELFQAGYIFYVSGAVVYLLAAIIGLYAGKRVIFGGSTAEMPEIRSVLSIGLKFAEGFRKAGQSDDNDEDLKKSAYMHGPGGPWINCVARCSKKDGCSKSDGIKQHTHATDCDGWTVTGEGPEYTLTATFFTGCDEHALYKQNGSKMTHTFKTKHDTLGISEVAGAATLTEGCSVGKASMTTQRILDLCDLYDCFDLDASGLLDKGDLIEVARAAGYQIDDQAMQTWIETQPRRSADQEDYGLDFPLFLTLASAESTSDKLELDKCWSKLNPDGDDKADVKEIKAMFKKNGLMNSISGSGLMTRTVEQFIELNSQDHTNFTKDDMLNFLGGRPPQARAGAPAAIPSDKLDVEVEADSSGHDQL